MNYDSSYAETNLRDQTPLKIFLMFSNGNSQIDLKLLHLQFLKCSLMQQQFNTRIILQLSKKICIFFVLYTFILYYIYFYF